MSATWIVAWLATYAVHSTVLIALAWAVSRSRSCSGRPRLAECLWRTALLGALVTASVQLALGPNRGIGPRWSLVAAASPDCGAVDGPAGEMSERLSTCGAVSSAPPAASVATLPTKAAALSEAFDAPTWIALLWAVGAGLGLARLALSWRHFARLVAGRRELCQPAERGVLDRLLAADASELPRVRLSVSDSLATPIGFGWRRPEIVVPARALTELGPRELESLFAHELAHFERRDPAWLLGLRAFEAIFFFQPLARLARRRLQELSEELCDRNAVQRTGLGWELALCLTRVAGWMRPETGALPVAHMAASASQLGRRVERLVQGSDQGSAGQGPSDEPGARWLVPSLAGFLGLASWGVPGFAAACGPARAAGPEPQATESAVTAVSPDAVTRTPDEQVSWHHRAAVLLPPILAGLDDLRTETRLLADEVRSAGLSALYGERLARIDQRLCALHGRTSRLLAACESP